MNYFGYIYKVTNLINNKIYIGKREKPEFDNAYWGSGKYFKNALKKYGRKNFIREVIEWCASSTQLREREEFWIKYYRNLNYNMYNIKDSSVGGNTLKYASPEDKMSFSNRMREIGKSSIKGRVMISRGDEVKYVKSDDLQRYLDLGYVRGNSKKTLDKISKSLKGRKQPRDLVEKRLNSCRGKKRSDEFRRHMSEVKRGKPSWNKGIPMRPESKDKMIKALKGRVRINNGVINKSIKPTDLDSYLSEGWVLGWLDKKG